MAGEPIYYYLLVMQQAEPLRVFGVLQYSTYTYSFFCRVSRPKRSVQLLILIRETKNYSTRANQNVSTSSTGTRRRMDRETCARCFDKDMEVPTRKTAEAPTSSCSTRSEAMSKYETPPLCPTASRILTYVQLLKSTSSHILQGMWVT